MASGDFNNIRLFSVLLLKEMEKIGGEFRMNFFYLERDAQLNQCGATHVLSVSSAFASFLIKIKLSRIGSLVKCSAFPTNDDITFLLSLLYIRCSAISPTHAFGRKVT